LSGLSYGYYRFHFIAPTYSSAKWTICSHSLECVETEELEALATNWRN